MIFFLFILFTTTLLSKEVINVPEQVEEVNLKTLEFLNHLTENKTKPVEKTLGFSYRYKPFFWSPYRFDVYVGKFSKKSEDSLIRIETPRSGESKVYRSVIEQYIIPEKKWDSPEIPIHSKYHFLYQPLNFISPTLGIIYSGYNSPFYLQDEMILKSVLYTLWDIGIISVLAIIAENTKKSKSLQDRLLLQPSENNLNLLTGKYAMPMFLVLSIPRVIRAVDGYYEIATQNRFAELGYTFRF